MAGRPARVARRTRNHLPADRGQRWPPGAHSPTREVAFCDPLSRELRLARPEPVSTMSARARYLRGLDRLPAARVAGCSALRSWAASRIGPCRLFVRTQ